MSDTRVIRNALVSVYHKEGLDEILLKLHEQGVSFLSTGGTQQFIEELGLPCQSVEELTGYPSILGGRVKTLHPKVFGGILTRRGLSGDKRQCEEYGIPEIDLVIVDLYPFEETMLSGAGDEEIIEKIDIGGISLIRAAAKNFRDVVIIASKAQYGAFLSILNEQGLRPVTKTDFGLPRKLLLFLPNTIQPFSIGLTRVRIRLSDMPAVRPRHYAMERILISGVFFMVSLMMFSSNCRGKRFPITICWILMRLFL
jgi:hypothetical protein